MALDETGLTIRRQPEVLSDLIASLQADVDSNIDTSDDTFLGQLILILSSEYASQEALTQAVYDNFNVYKAEGKNLDDLAALVGISRISGRATSGTLDIIGADGSVIPAGSLFSNPITLDRFFNAISGTITTAACKSARYSVKTLLDSTIYTISINGTDYTYTSDASATELEILNGLKAQIDLDSAATWTATVDTPNLQLILATSNEANINISSITYIGSDDVTGSVDIEAEVVGVVIAPADTVTNIVVGPPATVSSITNPLALTTGNVREDDETLRNRILNNQEVTGTATVEAIQARLRAVTGVTTAIVIENDLEVVDGDGRPPKSFESVVEGGTDEDVANLIWLTKPAGISTYGSTSENITDSNGQQKTINFSRPTPLHIAIRVSYTKYSEEDFPADGESTMTTTVVDHTNALGLGVDVITGRYKGDLYANVTGVDTYTVEAQTLANSGDAPLGGSWSTVTIPVGLAEFASTASIDVTILEV